MGKTMRALGLMSGTSMDGIDVALIDTDGEESVQRGPGATFPYSAAVRGQLGRPSRRPAPGPAQARPGMLADVERELTELHAAAVGASWPTGGAAAIDVIGFHGQTVCTERRDGARPGPNAARPEDRTLTVQLGDGPLLARLTGIDVVYDLRAADCAAGGQGAPLAPVYHRALAARLPERPVVVLNIGGVANVTWIGRDGALIAFDTGPGNALIDDWMARHTGRASTPTAALPPPAASTRMP